MEALQLDIVLRHIHNLKPALHITRIGEPFQFRNFLFLTIQVLIQKIYRPLATAEVLTQNRLW